MMTTSTTPRFAIGQQFYTRGKVRQLCTIVDILSTYNANGELVRIRYVATHEFMGQLVHDYDVPDSTVAMGLTSS
jgi:hypothetical protein